MSMYFSRLQPALQNLLQRVVRFFHPRSSRTFAGRDQRSNQYAANWCDAFGRAADTSLAAAAAAAAAARSRLFNNSSYDV